MRVDCFLGEATVLGFGTIGAKHVGGARNICFLGAVF